MKSFVKDLKMELRYKVTQKVPPIRTIAGGQVGEYDMYEIHAGHNSGNVGQKRVPNDIKVEMDRKSSKSILIYKRYIYIKLWYFIGKLRDGLYNKLIRVQ